MPAFPLPAPTARERAVWKELWRTPQAAIWNVERWRMQTVGLYCRTMVRCEDPEVPVSAIGQLLRLGDQLGMTPAGLKENGWRLAVDEVAAQRTTATSPTTTKARTTKAATTRRLRAVGE